jgi:hypothetical protein
MASRLSRLPVIDTLRAQAVPGIAILQCLILQRADIFTTDLTICCQARYDAAVLIRHGDSTWNAQNRFTGRVDVPLSPRGREDARKAARLPGTYGIVMDVCFTAATGVFVRVLAPYLVAAT